MWRSLRVRLSAYAFSSRSSLCIPCAHMGLSPPSLPPSLSPLSAHGFSLSHPSLYRGLGFSFSTCSFGFIMIFCFSLSPPLNETPRASRSSAALSAWSDAALIEQFTTMSREFSAMVVAGSAMQLGDAASNVDNETALVRIGEEDRLEETNQLAIVPDTNPIPSPRRAPPSKAVAAGAAALEEVSVVQELQRKLEEQRARAIEKVQNDVARARRKAEEKRASAEAKRGTKVVRVLELASFMRAVGRAPSKRSFF